ncbi:MAG: phage major capsid protein, partial [Mesorhizobium sp.]
MSLKDLNEKRGVLVAQAREALDAIKKNTDEARAAELDARHDTIMADFDKIEATIAREERVAAAEARINAAADEERKNKRPISGDATAGGEGEGDVLAYRSVFHKFIARGGDPSELTGEERAVLRAGIAPKDAEKRIQTAGTTTAGGYTVPVELANVIIETMKAWGPMYDDDICTVMTTASGN